MADFTNSTQDNPNKGVHFNGFSGGAVPQNPGQITVDIVKETVRERNGVRVDLFRLPAA